VHENIIERVHERVEETVSEVSNDTLADDEVSDDLDQMIRDGEPEFLDTRNLKKLEQMGKDAKTLLYQGSRVTKLEADLLLLEPKSSNGLTDKGFDDLLCLLQKLLPTPNELPENTYQAKQMICPMGLEVQKLHACRNECILYRGNYKDFDSCQVRKASWYKCSSTMVVKSDRNKRPPMNVVVLPNNSSFEKMVCELRNSQADKVPCWRLFG
jgi:hypothetical protein